MLLCAVVVADSSVSYTLLFARANHRRAFSAKLITDAARKLVVVVVFACRPWSKISFPALRIYPAIHAADIRIEFGFIIFIHVQLITRYFLNPNTTKNKKNRILTKIIAFILAYAHIMNHVHIIKVRLY